MSLLTKLFDFLFPPDPLVVRLENMEPEALSEFELFAASERQTVYLFKYQEPLIRRAIWEIKYRGNEKIARLFASALFETLAGALENLDPLGKTRPLLTVVPMSEKRARERGVNHLSLLTKSLPEEARNFFDIDAQVLKKIRETVPQTSLQKKKDRLKNPAGSLEVARPEKVAGKTVFVIDDVTTTGATLLEAKRALLQTGAKKVICFALAH